MGSLHLILVTWSILVLVSMGCPWFYYGPECKNICSVRCRGPCDPKTGLCSACKKMYHGLGPIYNCNLSCPRGCDGWCYNGGKCPCRTGFWGEYCQKTCSKTCKHGCYWQTGECTCPKGWFGKRCEYKCHCRYMKCRMNGQCESRTTCEIGWFGTECQQYDHIVDGTVSLVGGDVRTVLNNDYLSCTWAKSVTVTWPEWAYPKITWMRIKTKKPWWMHETSWVAYTERFIFKFTTPDGTVHPCKNPRQFTISNSKMFVYAYCDNDHFVKKMEITWTQPLDLCTLHVSGGRNVAMKQTAVQLSTSGNHEASLAVDGVRFEHEKMCSSTSTDEIPQQNEWNLYLPRTHKVIRYVIYNVDKADLQWQLNGFTLTSYDSSDRETFKYTDTSTTGSAKFTLWPPPHEMNRMRIESLPNTTLRLCEVEVYADCPTGKVGLECSRPCRNCTKRCRQKCTKWRCDEQDCAGCSPFSGACAVCPYDYFGKDCSKKCNCKTLACAVNGRCQDGSQCKAGWLGQDCQTACPGWFGEKCLFKCHCIDNSCAATNGICQDGAVCEQGWFGPSCQYSNLLTAGRLLLIYSDTSALMDNNDTTCTASMQSPIMSVIWESPQPFTWMEVVVGQELDEGSSRNLFSLKFTSADGKDLTCENFRQYILNRNTVHIYCDVDVAIKNMNMFYIGVISICSLYISGGRNVALRQPANLHPLSENQVAAFAVDGNRGLESDENNITCSFTINDPTKRPTVWEVVLSNSFLVNRYLIFNVHGEKERRHLAGFILSSFDAQGKQSFNYIDQSQKGQDTYTIITSPHMVKRVEVQKFSTSPETFLSLCEVEVYGECPVGYYGLYCKDKCPKNCLGCSALTGECYKCVAGYYGLDCKLKCHESCKVGEGCSRTSGACGVCAGGHWGLECLKHCDSKCKDSCDPETGMCPEGLLTGPVIAFFAIFGLGVITAGVIALSFLLEENRQEEKMKQ